LSVNLHTGGATSLATSFVRAGFNQKQTVSSIH